MNSKLLVGFVLICVSFVWAGSFIVVQLATKELSPVFLGFLRFFIATPIMVSILFFRKKSRKLPKNEFPYLILLGLTGVTLLYIFQFTGIALTTASTAAVLINTNVIFIALFSALFFKELFGKKKIIGILLCFLGVIIIVISHNASTTFLLEDSFFIGSILILLSALCWAVYSIVGKHLIQRYDILSVTTYALLFGTICYIPFIISDFPSILQISFFGWIAVLYLAVGCTVFAYLGWFYALHKNQASKAAVYLNLIPLFTIVMSFFVGENFTFYFILGAILIIYGVYLTEKSK
ncbi:MAG: DMT family transporter [Thermoplasmatota archaeon]